MDFKKMDSSLKCFFLFFLLLIFSCQSSRSIAYEQKLYKNFKYDYTQPNFSLQNRPNFLWGINGHSLKPSYAFKGKNYNNQYLKFSFSEQIQILKELDVNIFRVDVHINENGIWNEKQEDFSKLLNDLNKNEIEMLPVILTNPWRTGDVIVGNNWNFNSVHKLIYSHAQDTKLSIEDLDIWKYYYELGSKTGRKFGSQFGDKLKYYQVGNEIAYYILKNYEVPNNQEYNSRNPNLYNNVDYFFKEIGGGDETKHFFTCDEHAKRTISSAGYVKGMIDGIKAVDEAAEIVINGTRLDYGYIKFLNIMDVNYDIVGWNWYSNFGSFSDKDNALNTDVYSALNELSNHKPIWITEFNKTLGSFYGEIAQAYEIRNFMEEFYQLQNVKGFFIYQLLDQEYTGDDGDHFGIITSPFPNKSKAKSKPAFNTYKYSIEEFNNGYSNFVNQLSRDLFGAEYQNIPDNSKNLTELIESGEKFKVVVNMLKEIKDVDWKVSQKMGRSEIEAFIEAVYLKFLNREVLNKELRFLYKNWNGENELLKKIVLSDEYWRNSMIKAKDDKNSNPFFSN